jgi:hypothetical protein
MAYLAANLDAYDPAAPPTPPCDQAEAAGAEEEEPLSRGYNRFEAHELIRHHGDEIQSCPHIILARDSQSGHRHRDRPLWHDRMTRGIVRSEAVMQVHLEIPEDLAKQLAVEPGDLTRAAIEGRPAARGR